MEASLENSTPDRPCQGLGEPRGIWETGAHAPTFSAPDASWPRGPEAPTNAPTDCSVRFACQAPPRAGRGLCGPPASFWHRWLGARLCHRWPRGGASLREHQGRGWASVCKDRDGPECLSPATHQEVGTPGSKREDGSCKEEEHQLSWDMGLSVAAAIHGARGRGQAGVGQALETLGASMLGVPGVSSGCRGQGSCRPREPTPSVSQINMIQGETYLQLLSPQMHTVTYKCTHTLSPSAANAHPYPTEAPVHTVETIVPRKGVQPAQVSPRPCR